MIQHWWFDINWYQLLIQCWWFGIDALSVLSALSCPGLALRHEWNQIFPVQSLFSTILINTVYIRECHWDLHVTCHHITSGRQCPRYPVKYLRDDLGCIYQNVKKTLLVLLKLILIFSPINSKDMNEISKPSSILCVNLVS